MNEKFVRITALIHKETRQMLRDKSTLTLGIVLPITLLLLFGYGLSLDVKNIPVAIVRESNEALNIYEGLKGSRYFNLSIINSWHDAENLLRSGKVDAIIRTSDNRTSYIQIVINGRDAQIMPGSKSNILKEL